MWSLSFIDLEKTNEIMWQYGILNDLFPFELKGCLPVLIQNFFNYRHFNVCLGSTLSDTFQREKVQGSILSVNLFSIKIDM